MRLVRAIVVLAVASTTCHAQSRGETADSLAKTRIATTRAPLPPSPPDAPILDQGATPVPDKSNSSVKHVLRRLAPNCLDAIFHLCWSFPPADGPVSSYEKRRVSEDLDIGSSYLKEKNYLGAEFRFEDALVYDPDNPEATFKLAEALAKLGKGDEAYDAYGAYLQIAPHGVFVERAKEARAHFIAKTLH